MSTADDLRHAVNDSLPRLLALGDASATPRADGKWSPKQIIGHLVDSGVNNLARMVRGQLQDDLVFPGYAQDDWVRISKYQDTPWKDLLTLWQLLNLQIARVIEGTPEKIKKQPRTRHSFDEIGVPLQTGEAATLDALMIDYVRHLKHHLRQILGA